MSNKIAKTFSIDSDVLKKVQESAVIEHRSLSNMVEVILRQYIEQRRSCSDIIKLTDKVPYFPGKVLMKTGESQ